MTALDDLSLLRGFVSIVECGSISAGARRLAISQPTLSRQLRLLEERCGGALLQRDTHCMSLTQMGHRLLADAQTMLAHAEEASQRLRDDQTALSGHLRVFASIDLGQSLVTRLLSRFLQMHPSVTAALSLTNRPLHMIQEGCDVGILPGKVTDESVIARPAGKIRLSLAASPSLIQSRKPVTRPDELTPWPWIGLSREQFWDARKITLYGPRQAEETLHLSPVLISEGVTSMREAVRCGLGIAVLPEWLIEEDLSTQRLARVLPAWKAKDLPVNVVYATSRLLPARVRAFVEFATSELRNELAR